MCENPLNDYLSRNQRNANTPDFYQLKAEELQQKLIRLREEADGEVEDSALKSSANGHMNHNPPSLQHQHPYESSSSTNTTIIPLIPTHHQHSNTSTLSSHSGSFEHPSSRVQTQPSPPRRFSQNNNHHKHYLRNSDNSELPLLDTTTCTTADDSCFSTSDSLLTTPDPRGGTLSTHEDDLNDQSRTSSLRARLNHQLPSPDTTLTNLSNHASSLLTTAKANNHMPPLQFHHNPEFLHDNRYL